MLVVDCIRDPVGRNQFPAMLNSSVQQSALSVEQTNALSSSVLFSEISVLLLSLFGPYSSVTPKQ